MQRILYTSQARNQHLMMQSMFCLFIVVWYAHEYIIFTAQALILWTQFLFCTNLDLMHPKLGNVYISKRIATLNLHGIYCICHISRWHKKFGARLSENSRRDWKRHIPVMCRWNVCNELYVPSVIIDKSIHYFSYSSFIFNSLVHVLNTGLFIRIL